MKIIKNISLPLSLEKGKDIICYDSMEEIISIWDVSPEMFKGLIKCKTNKDIIGYVKAHSFDLTSKCFEFIPIYEKEEENGDFKTLFDKVIYYQGFIIIYQNERQKRMFMLEIDRNKMDNIFNFEDF